MTAPRSEPEFLSLHYSDVLGRDDDEDSMNSPIQPHLDTLFAEFSRSRQRLTPPPASISSRRLRRTQSVREAPASESKVDLRALDYVSDYDSHLMCPICHVPFVDPVVLDCDHTFCRQCYEEYRVEADSRTQCPTCRAPILTRPLKASRLIVNMCDNVSVRCPNEDCTGVYTRGYIEQHATKDCRDYQLDCPGEDCDKKVKRKNYIEDQCIHSSHIECDCGAIIELGRGEWLKHKDEDCPTTGVKCDSCDERISVRAYFAGQNGHVCKTEASSYCPGCEYGCTTEVPFSTPEELEFHTATCPFARLAPYLKKQAETVQSLTEQLTMTKVRNEVLETGLDRINDILNTRVLPAVPTPHDQDDDESPRPPRVPSPTLSIEEVPRHHEHDHHGFDHHNLQSNLPAHYNPYATPGRDQQPVSAHDIHHHLSTTVNLLSSHMSEQIVNLNAKIADLDARSSMMIMNETLRMKEELAQQGAGLFSTRAQVQWLLNRERERMQMAAAAAAGSQLQQSQNLGGGGNNINNTNNGDAGPAPLARGRSSNVVSGSTPLHGSAMSGIGVGSSSMTPADGTAAGGSGMGEGSTSSARSSFSNSNAPGGVGVGVGVGLDEVTGSSPRVRPSLRRLSGSQERVKL